MRCFFLRAKNVVNFINRFSFIKGGIWGNEERLSIYVHSEFRKEAVLKVASNESIKNVSN